MKGVSILVNLKIENANSAKITKEKSPPRCKPLNEVAYCNTHKAFAFLLLLMLMNHFFLVLVAFFTLSGRFLSEIDFTIVCPHWICFWSLTFASEFA